MVFYIIRKNTRTGEERATGFYDVERRALRLVNEINESRKCESKSETARILRLEESDSETLQQAIAATAGTESESVSAVALADSHARPPGD